MRSGVHRSVSERVGGSPPILPYDHICYCGQVWTVTEENKTDHEVVVARHRDEHKDADRRARKASA